MADAQALADDTERLYAGALCTRDRASADSSAHIFVRRTRISAENRCGVGIGPRRIRSSPAWSAGWTREPGMRDAATRIQGEARFVGDDTVTAESPTTTSCQPAGVLKGIGVWERQRSPSICSSMSSTFAYAPGLGPPVPESSMVIEHLAKREIKDRAIAELAAPLSGSSGNFQGILHCPAGSIDHRSGLARNWRADDLKPYVQTDTRPFRPPTVHVRLRGPVCELRGNLEPKSIKPPRAARPHQRQRTRPKFRRNSENSFIVEMTIACGFRQRIEGDRACDRNRQRLFTC